MKRLLLRVPFWLFAITTYLATIGIWFLLASAANADDHAHIQDDGQRITLSIPELSFEPDLEQITEELQLSPLAHAISADWMRKALLECPGESGDDALDMMTILDVETPGWLRVYAMLAATDGRTKANEWLSVITGTPEFRNQYVLKKATRNARRGY